MGQLSMKKRESAMQKKSAKDAKQEPMNHHQSCCSPSSLAVFVTDCLELKLAYTAINEHTVNMNTIFKILNDLSEY